ncbi:MAG: amino acid racemase [Candidatus Heimdallarchaeota archaeon]|nr:amino acid racemase [Candidatus Heimdallarchaeota archaeon]
MKKIGIIGGMSAYSTIDYYRIIIDEYKKIHPGAMAPELVIDSLNHGKMAKLIATNRWDKVLNELVHSAENLMKAKAEVLIIAANTPHILFDKFVKKVKVPMISIMEATGKAIQNKKLTKVGLIGTKNTMDADYYSKTLNKMGIEIIVPEEEDKRLIDEIIKKELILNILTEESKRKYIQIMDKLRNVGVEGIILGCTEIPMLIKEKDYSLPLFDTTYLHAKAVLDYVLKE